MRSQTDPKIVEFIIRELKFIKKGEALPILVLANRLYAKFPKKFKKGKDPDVWVCINDNLRRNKKIQPYWEKHKAPGAHDAHYIIRRLITPRQYSLIVSKIIEKKMIEKTT